MNQLCSANVVGRDELIASVWRLLQHRSLRFTADSPQRWTVVLDQVLSELCQHAPHRKLLLLLDELPYMLQRFAADGCPGDALLLLDCLRAARQKYAGLRMIFAGSIGLHHVLRELRQQSLASEPVNDMPAVEIRGLEPAAGCLLASQLLHSFQLHLDPTQASAVVERITQRTDGVPFYMAAVAQRLAQNPDTVTPHTVDSVVRQLLTADSDPWEMEHFRSRLPVYYRSAVSDANGRHLIQLLRSLALDHYLVSSVDKTYSFRFPLIRSWWQIAQGLES